MVLEGRQQVPTRRPVVKAELATRLDVLHLERFEIGTSYVIQVDAVLARLEGLLALCDPERSLPILAVDYTGVGRPVVDMFRAKGCPIPLIAITSTSGETAHADSFRPGHWTDWTVPKKELVAPLLVGVQNERVKIAPGLELATQALKEMQQFRMKRRIVSGAVSYESLTEDDHDDLVMSMALAAWVAHKIDQAGMLL
jgi:hypothetical protein